MGEVVDLAEHRAIDKMRRDVGAVFGERTFACELAGAGLATSEGKTYMLVGLRSGEEHCAAVLSVADARELLSALGVLLSGLDASTDNDDDA